MIEAPTQYAPPQYPSLPEPPKRKRSMGPGFVVAGLIIGGFVLYGIGHSEVSPSIAQPTVTTPDSLAITDPAPSRSTVYADWAEKSYPVVEQFMGDLTAAGDASTQSEMKVACRAIGNDISSMRSVVIADGPDADFNVKMSTSMDYTQKAVNACMRGDWETASANIITGSHYLTVATDRLSELAAGL